MVKVAEGVHLSKHYCLYLPEIELAAISDLHLGYEAVLHEEGISIPHFQRGIMEKRLEALLDDLEPKRLLINGDLKHQFSRNMRQEWSEVTELLDMLEERVELTLTRGNHDNYLISILRDYDIELPLSADMGGVHFTHGHRPVGEHEGLLVLGHEHPSIRLRDTMGLGIKIPCFLHFPEIRTVVLPAFSPLASGTEVYPQGDRYLSPFLRDREPGRMEAYGVTEEGLLEFTGI